MKNLFPDNPKTLSFIQQSVIVVIVLIFLGYKLHDFTEPFSFGHVRWGDATFYWFGMMHCDLGYSKTNLLNVEGIMETGELHYYLSVGPLEGIVHSLFLCGMDGAHWSVRILPLFANLFILGILLLILRRFTGSGTGSVLAILFLASPFVLKYGSNDAGFMAIPLSLGVLGWYSYLVFLEKKQSYALAVSIVCFSIGTLSTWQAGIMAIPVFLHILFSDQPIQWRIKVLSAFSILMFVSIAGVLIHQGIVTGEYFYPLKRVLYRGGASGSNLDTISWTQLFILQTNRGWNYFGQITSILLLYWLLKSTITKTIFRGPNGWITAFILSGLFYGFILRNAAFHHDFLMLGLLPGIMLAASTGAYMLYRDISKAFSDKWGHAFSTIVISVLMAGHLAVAVKSAQAFEEIEHNDINHGQASVAPYLARNLSDNHILAADMSTGYSLTLGSDGEMYANLKPHLAYLTRRPVHFVNSLQSLDRLLVQAQKMSKVVVLIQLDWGSTSRKASLSDREIILQKLNVPSTWIIERYDFEKGKVLFLSMESKNDF